MRFSMGSGLLAFLILFPVPARAITLGQIETFDGTEGGWGASLGELISDGGPNGAGDAYLLASTTGSPSRLSAFTRLWRGDYAAAGVTAIEADIVNLGDAILSLRLSLFADGALYQSSLPLLLPADQIWHHAQFDVVYPHVTPDPAVALSDVSSIRFQHQVELTDTPGTPVLGSFGIDNIRAIPEPASLGLFLGAIVLFARRRSRQSQRLCFLRSNL